ncbi:MAG: hypothetical protein HYX61_11480 [Gammaproteobacteria bacterium]|jgi:hypothetical protein|nr:hypothetical protein [Gammaproteobacteria bacterium]
MSEKKLPTLANTYLNSAQLYVRTFIDVFPFILLLMLSRFLLDKVMPNEAVLNLRFFLRIIIDSSITALFFSFILYMMYQRYHKNNVSLRDVIFRGAKRCIHILLAYMFISLPILFSLLLIKIDTMLWQPYVITPDFVENQRWFALGILGTGMLTTAILAIFSFVAGIYIITKNENAASGLRKSFKMVQSYWVDTFLIIALFGIMSISLGMVLEEYRVPMAIEILCLLFSSFYPALMIIHYENMNKLIQSSPVIQDFIPLTPVIEGKRAEGKNENS